MMELTREQQLQRLQIHEREWTGAQYDAELNARIAKVLDDAQMLEQTTAQLKRVLKALDVIRAEIDKLQDGE